MKERRNLIGPVTEKLRGSPEVRGGGIPEPSMFLRPHLSPCLHPVLSPPSSSVFCRTGFLPEVSPCSELRHSRIILGFRNPNRACVTLFQASFEVVISIALCYPPLTED